MLIKSADDKSKRLRLLQELQSSPNLDARQRDWLAKNLHNTRQGVSGEQQAAHYLDNYLRDSKNHMLIHDLRIVVEGEVAQIDHLLIGRSIFYLFETKTFGGNLVINDYGEFTVEYPGEKLYGIPSPIEQSRRHANVLARLLETLEIGPRLGSKPRFEHIVLVDPSRTIQRPNPKKLDTSHVIKADAFPSWHKNFSEKALGIAETLALFADMRSQETVKAWAEKIARQHRPTNLLDLPDFMAPRAPAPKPPTRPANVPPAPLTAAPVPNLPPKVTPEQLSQSLPNDKAEAKRLICVTCNEKITFAEGRFCWSNEKRFNGKQYCRAHQADFK